MEAGKTIAARRMAEGIGNIESRTESKPITLLALIIDDDEEQK